MKTRQATTQKLTHRNPTNFLSSPDLISAN
jgi:hypothetical protein